MESTGLLETIARVSATFAGFSGIVSVVGKWTVEPSERLCRWMPESYRHGFFSKPLPAALTVASLVFVVVELTVSIGVATGYASALYVCGLLYLLFLSACHFVRVILSAQPA